MDAAALGHVDDLDFDLGSLDGFECFDFDFDLPDNLPGFYFDGGCLLPAVSDKEGGLVLSLGSRDCDGDRGDGGRESSPDSVVTDDGAPRRSSESSGACDDGEMSAYVRDLERFLLGEDDGEAGGLLPVKDLAPDGPFFNDLIVPYVEPSTAPEEFAADDHFFGDLDAAYAEPATPGKDLLADDYFFSDLVYIEPSTAGEDPVSDGYFYDAAVVEDGCIERTADASVDDAASATEDEGAAAGEYDDEASSRKRASPQAEEGHRRGATRSRARATPRTPAISSTGCRRLGHHRLPPCVPASVFRGAGGGSHPTVSLMDSSPSSRRRESEDNEPSPISFVLPDYVPPPTSFSTPVRGVGTSSDSSNFPSTGENTIVLHPAMHSSMLMPPCAVEPREMMMPDPSKRYTHVNKSVKISSRRKKWLLSPMRKGMTSISSMQEQQILVL